MKKQWYIGAGTSFKEKSESAFHFEQDGETVQFKDGDGVSHAVTLAKMASCGIKTAEEAVSAIRKALPEECQHLYDTFDYRRLTDNLLSWESVFQQKPNSAYLDPMCIAVEEAVMKTLSKPNGDGRLRQAASLKWVALEERILAACLANYLLFSPMPARDFQVKGLAPGGMENEARARNIIILDKQICLVNPPMKGPKATRLRRAEALWALAVMICNPFAFCMGVLRPAFTKVLGKLDRDISLREKHIFVHPVFLSRKKDPGIFTGSDVNKALQALTSTLPVKLTAGKLRHFSTVMFQEHYPEFVEKGTSKADNLVDKLGQHSHVTSSTHYSQVQTQSPQLGMLLTRARHYLELCEVYHATFGIATASAQSEDSMNKSQMFSGRKYEDIAFKEARAIVCRLYKLGGTDKASVGDAAQNLLASKPYMV